jgi:hypothetical protein
VNDDSKLASTKEQSHEHRVQVAAKPTKHEEARARILAAQAEREAVDVLARGPIGSARRKARTNWAASESQRPSRLRGRPLGPR